MSVRVRAHTCVCVWVLVVEKVGPPGGSPASRGEHCRAGFTQRVVEDYVRKVMSCPTLKPFLQNLHQKSWTYACWLGGLNGVAIGLQCLQTSLRSIAGVETTLTCRYVVEKDAKCHAVIQKMSQANRPEYLFGDAHDFFRESDGEAFDSLSCCRVKALACLLACVLACLLAISADSPLQEQVHVFERQQTQTHEKTTNNS